MNHLAPDLETRSDPGRSGSPTLAVIYGNRDFFPDILVTEARKAGDWDRSLSRELKASRATPVNIRLTLYYAWGNRGQGEMAVWMPRAR